MEIKDNIKQKRLENNLTLEEVAKKVGVAKATVQKWESGLIANMRRDKIILLAEALHTTPAYILGIDDNSMLTNYALDKEVVKIPVYGTIPAGVPIEAIEEILDYEEIPEKLAKTGVFFGLKVKGSSMYPKIENGDIVIIRQQENFENGDICVIMVNGFDATLKKVKKEKTEIELIPINPEYETKSYTAEQCQNLPVRILGKVVEIRRTL